jgi:hypothetical protein
MIRLYVTNFCGFILYFDFILTLVDGPNAASTFVAGMSAVTVN